jgi:hypothetical protein
MESVSNLKPLLPPLVRTGEVTRRRMTSINPQTVVGIKCGKKLLEILRPPPLKSDVQEINSCRMFESEQGV